MCGHVVASGETMVVEDIARDPRFANNPALLANGLRFCTGAPFGDAAGHVFGSLCLMDTKPHTLTAREIKLLGTLASDLSAALQLDSSVALHRPLLISMHETGRSAPAEASLTVTSQAEPAAKDRMRPVTLSWRWRHERRHQLREQPVARCQFEGIAG
jgi:hypothetical protein